MRTIDTGFNASPGDDEVLQINIKDWLNGGTLIDEDAVSEDITVLIVNSIQPSVESLIINNQYDVPQLCLPGEAVLVSYSIVDDPDITKGLIGIDVTVVAIVGIRESTTRYQINVV